ncbi:restriction endonuclease [Sulfurovum sp. CS9]|uniref:restriction endonuclease n=1 Tax=Sulfurovum sp. CS9 TaxID=3391146 RepID=UPI0039E9E7EF
MEFWLYVVGGFILFAKSLDFFDSKKENLSLKKEVQNFKEDIATLNKEKIEAKAIIDKYQSLFNETLDHLMKESVLLPSLTRWTNKLQEYQDEKIVNHLRRKKRPARKASEEVKIARAKAREYKNEVEVARNSVELYEALAPWITNFTDYSLEDMLSSLREEQERTKSQDDEHDPVSKYLTKLEWQKLTVSERNQLALDRYNNPRRKRSLWRIGIAYERFIGYEFEKQGNKVEYYGAIHGKQDLGIDLVCENEKVIYIVQCKRLSRVKEIPVRENIIAQIYGAAQLYKMRNEVTKSVIPVIVTSYELSEEAKSFAQFLNVRVLSNYELAEYPMIKCNISREADKKIYHLPMDQQYDKVIIGDNEGEFYAATVAEAEEKGFRRAYRWRGSN